MKYKFLQLLEDHKVEVDKFFYGVEPCQSVERIELLEGDDGWDYVAYFVDGGSLSIPKTSVIFAQSA